MQVEIQKYVKEKKQLYSFLLSFLNDSDDNENDENYSNFFKSQKYTQSKDELEKFLQILISISDNHHRHHTFFAKVTKILDDLSQKIKQIMTNSEIFEIFKTNKLILLFLMQNQTLIIDEDIVKTIIFEFQSNLAHYYHFFYPEIKEFVENKKIKLDELEFVNLDSNDLNNFEKKRQIGENDSYICSLIRNDSVEEFISYLNRTNTSPCSKIKPSIFETNLFLIDKEPSLIEYASFYGSIQIIQYLKYSNVQMTSSLWTYAIHSNNAELIHLLEENCIELDKNDYERILIESIKCHHNEIADYIKDNLMNNKENELIVSNILKYYNYYYFPKDLSQNNVFIHLCKYKYSILVNFYIELKKNEIKKIIAISETKIFFYKVSY